MTSKFEDAARADRESRPTPVSPKDSTYFEYIKHSLQFFHEGVATYTQRKYARLSLDAYILSQKAMDKITGEIVNNKSALVFIGSANMSPNSPIKKYQKCPGTRKLAISLKKRGNCDMVYVDEFKTSQVCGKCFAPFPVETRTHRMKVCQDCKPSPLAMPAKKISTYISRRELKAEKKKLKEQQQQDNQPMPIIVSKKKQFIPKDISIIAVDSSVAPRSLKTIWHRDISAAKAIMHKGNHHII